MTTAGSALAALATFGPGRSRARAADAHNPASGAIDCQSHLFCPELVQMMERRTTDPVVYRKDNDQFVRMGDWNRRIMPDHMNVEAKLAAMDANGIAMTALSINDPGPEWFGTDGPAVAQIANDFVAHVVKQHSDRFFGLGVLPLPDMTATTDELDRCVGRLGFKGFLIYTNLAGRFHDEPEFRPLFARAAELGVPLLLHPAKPVTSAVLKQHELISAIGNMFDDTIALARIMMSGILDEYPTLKLVCPHLGGTLPFILGRLEHQVKVLKRGPKNLQRSPREYLQQVYLDIVSPLPEAIRMVHDLFGPDRMIFGSDHPWVDPKVILDALRGAKLGADVEGKIASENAKRLFRL
jgi:predicted TIM-barrel fold metal-dependent hydrolase